MSTRSPTCSGKPASSTIMAPRLESPLPDAESLSWFCPTLPPISVASTTNAIHPRIAVLRCVALHLPARAARFLGCKSQSPVGWLSTGRNPPSDQTPPQGGLPASERGDCVGSPGGWRPAAGGWPHLAGQRAGLSPGAAGVAMLSPARATCPGQDQCPRFVAVALLHLPRSAAHDIPG